MICDPPSAIGKRSPLCWPARLFYLWSEWSMTVQVRNTQTAISALMSAPVAVTRVDGSLTLGTQTTESDFADAMKVLETAMTAVAETQNDDGVEQVTDHAGQLSQGPLRFVCSIRMHPSSVMLKKQQNPSRIPRRSRLRLSLHQLQVRFQFSFPPAHNHHSGNARL